MCAGLPAWLGWVGLALHRVAVFLGRVGLKWWPCGVACLRQLFAHHVALLTARLLNPAACRSRMASGGIFSESPLDSPAFFRMLGMVAGLGGALHRVAVWMRAVLPAGLGWVGLALHRVAGFLGRVGLCLLWWVGCGVLAAWVGCSSCCMGCFSCCMGGVLAAWVGCSSCCRGGVLAAGGGRLGGASTP